MTKLDMLVENQNLKKMLEIMREDVEKNCVDCENKIPCYNKKYRIYEEPNCNQCVFGKYRKERW